MTPLALVNRVFIPLGWVLVVTKHKETGQFVGIGFQRWSYYLENCGQSVADKMREEITSLHAAIEHGDTEHRQWLLDKIVQHFTCLKEPV